MNEREKQILNTIAKALPNMNDFDKGYFLGTAEAFAKDKKDKKTRSGQYDKKAG